MRRDPTSLALLAILSLALGCTAAPPDPGGGLDPGVAPLVRRGESAAQAGDWDLAIRSYEEALERTPWNTRFERLLAVAHAERAAQQRARGGREALEAAVADLRRAREIDAADATFRTNLAVVLVELARVETDPARAAAAREEAAGARPRGGVRRPGPGPARGATPGPGSRADRSRSGRRGRAAPRGRCTAIIPRARTSPACSPRRWSVSEGERAEQRNHVDAADAYERAVALYAALAPCDGTRCSLRELRAAHYNRLVNLIESGDRDAARQALQEAREHDLRFPALEAAFRR